MSLKKIGNYMKNFYVFFIIFSFVLAGCGEIEETTQEEVSKKPSKPTTQTITNAPEKEEDPMSEVLKAFVGDIDETSSASVKGSSAASGPQAIQYEKELEELRTENTDLKQRIIKLEQESRGANVRLAEVEAKYAAEKLRADKAEELLKGPPIAPPQPVIEEPVEPTPSVAYSPSTYDEALRHLKNKQYKDAEKKFKLILDNAKDPKQKNLATYWLGETYYSTKRYSEALKLFQETLKYKASTKKADAQFMVAQSYDRLGDKVKAKAEYEKFIKNYPMSKNIKRAKQRWSQL